MPLQVFGAGFGRTGTLSLKLALEELQLGPCYHMREVSRNPSHVDLWVKAIDGEMTKSSWDELFKDYQSGVDWPVAMFWRELMEAYPDAKIILSVRDPERWYQSSEATIFNFSRMNSQFPMTLLRTMVPTWRKFRKVIDGIFDYHFHGDLSKENTIKAYNTHIEEGRSLYT